MSTPEPELGLRREEVAVVGGLSSQCKLWSGVSFVGAAAYVVAFARGGFGPSWMAAAALAAVFHVALAIYLAAAGARLGRVVSTQGRDVSHAMKAVSHLSTALALQVVVAVIAVLVAATASAPVVTGGWR